GPSLIRSLHFTAAEEFDHGDLTLRSPISDTILKFKNNFEESGESMAFDDVVDMERVGFMSVSLRDSVCSERVFFRSVYDILDNAFSEWELRADEYGHHPLLVPDLRTDISYGTNSQETWSEWTGTLTLVPGQQYVEKIRIKSRNENIY